MQVGDLGRPYVLHYNDHLELGDGRWLGIRRHLFQPYVDFYELTESRVVGRLSANGHGLSVPDIEGFVPDYLAPQAILFLVLGQLATIVSEWRAATSASEAGFFVSS